MYCSRIALNSYSNNAIVLVFCKSVRHLFKTDVFIGLICQKKYRRFELSSKIFMKFITHLETCKKDRLFGIFKNRIQIT